MDIASTLVVIHFALGLANLLFLFILVDERQYQNVCQEQGIVAVLGGLILTTIVGCIYVKRKCLGNKSGDKRSANRIDWINEKYEHILESDIWTRRSDDPKKQIECLENGGKEG